MTSTMNALFRQIVIGAVFLSTPALAQRLVPTPPDVPYKHAYHRLYFTSNRIGYVAGNYVLLRTTDGGVTWSELINTYSDTRSPIYDIFFVNEHTFFLYGAGRFSRTSDKGDTFQLVQHTARSLDHPEVPDEVNEGFFFVDGDRGWALGTGQFLRTTDGGLTWTPRRMARSIQEGARPGQLWMFDAQRGIGFGGRQVIRTADGGDTWQVVANSPRIDLVRCVPAGFCVGLDRRAPSTAFMTTDFGGTWQPTATGILDDPEKETVNGLQAIAVNDVVIVGDLELREVIWLTDRPLDAPIPTFPPRPSPVPNHAFLQRWDGSAWHRTEYPEIETLWAIDFVTATDVWASADTNGILHSTDGAQTWTFVPDYYRQIAALTPTMPPLVLPTPTP